MCFQEVNDFWLDKISHLLTGWVLHKAPSPTNVVIAHHWEWREVTAAILPLFPNEEHAASPYRWWRQFLQVSAGHLSVRSFA
jgi:hypothetical protein